MNILSLDAGPLEKDIEGPAKQYAKKRGWMVVKLMRCDINSMPDTMFIRRGVVMFIEFKKFGIEPNDQQLKRHRDIRAKGIAVHVCDTLEMAHELLR
jgi:hypothetical protein